MYLNLFDFVVGDVVADGFVEAKVDFANFSNVQVLSDDDKHPIAESKEEHTGLNSDPRETALDPGEAAHPGLSVVSKL